ncbi:sulfotransferase domain-containing protein [Alphaproteobacteria bacterium]|jgi:hypothetical protein|nr:sulfotransferase domain-containing protein [Alphaproteobacteria bacterium]
MLKRPTNIQDMIKASDKFFSEDCWNSGLAFKPRSDDVIISTFAKSGTTWMQQIIHCLRTGGDMSFEEISLVIPWIETALDLGIDLEAEQPYPRAFKAHLPADVVPKGAKYIVLFRDPAAVVRSYYSFMEDWNFVAGTVTIDEFADLIIFDVEETFSLWHFFKTWWPLRNDPDVLMMCYEDMIGNEETVIRRATDHAGIELTEELLAITLEKSSHAFMKAHDRQFDDHATSDALDERCGLPPERQTSKVTTNSGKVVLTDRVLEKLKNTWAKEIEAELGFTNYDEFRQSIK